MEALKEAGNVCLKQGLLEESREEYSKAIDLGTDFLLASMPNNHPGPESEEDDEDTDEGSSTQGSVVRGDRGSKQRGETKEGRGAGTEVEAEEEEAALHRLMAILLSNRALTCLKLGDPKTALWDSIQAERLSPSYCKAPLRRGAAREAQQEWALAAEAYDRAATIASSSSSLSPTSSSPSAAEQAPSSPSLSASDLSIMKAALAARNRCQAKLKEQRSGEQQQQQGQQRQRAI